MWHLKRHFTDGMHRDAQDFASLGCSLLAALEDDEAFSNCINNPAHSSPPALWSSPWLAWLSSTSGLKKWVAGDDFLRALQKATFEYLYVE